VSGTTVAEFLGYWETEGAAYVRHGDYDWMAALVPGKRVLEIGCGLGFGTQALANRGLAVLAIDTLDECLAASQQKTEGQAVSFLLADVCSLNEVQRQSISDFAPDGVVCWLMGAPADTTGATQHDGGQAVAAYRNPCIAKWQSWRPACLQYKHCIWWIERLFPGKPRILAGIRWSATIVAKPCLTCRFWLIDEMPYTENSATMSWIWRLCADRTPP